MNPVMTKNKNTNSFNIKTLFVIYLIVFLGSAGYFMTIPAYVELFLSNTNHIMIHSPMSLASRRELFGTVMSIAPFISMFFTPFFARLSDVYGRKYFILLALVIAGCGFLLPILAIAVGSVFFLFVGSMLNSLGSAGQPIAQACLTEMSETKQKTLLLSMIAVVLTIAMAFGPALGSKLLSIYGPTAPFYACLVIAIICFCSLSFLVPQSTLQRHEIKRQKMDWLGPFKRKKKGLFAALAVVFFTQFGWSLYFQNLSFLLPEQWHVLITSSDYQFYMMGIGIAMIIALLFVPRYLQTKYSLLQSLQGALLIAALGMFMLVFMPTYWAEALVLIPVVAAIAVAFPFYITFVSELAAGQDQGVVMALASALIGLAWTLTGYLSAVFASWSLSLPIILGSLSIFVSFVFVFFLTKRTSVLSF